MRPIASKCANHLMGVVIDYLHVDLGNRQQIRGVITQGMTRKHAVSTKIAKKQRHHRYNQELSKCHKGRKLLHNSRLQTSECHQVVFACEWLGEWVKCCYLVTSFGEGGRGHWAE